VIGLEMIKVIKREKVMVMRFDEVEAKILNVVEGRSDQAERRLR
jgi:hypothetical protein